jgi:hypothetical protein
MEGDTRFSGWAKVSLFGHAHAYGFVDVVQIGGAGEGGFGTNMLRVRSPAIEGWPEHVNYFGIGAIFQIQPCSEEVVRAEYADEAAWNPAVRPLTETTADDSLPF